MKLQLVSTKPGSPSLKRVANALTQKLGYKVFRRKFVKPKRATAYYGQGVDKLTQYKWFKEQGLSALKFTTSTQVVQDEWLCQGKTVFGRKLLTSSCGKGIVVMEPNSPIDEHCPVYTLYKKKKREFRVHVFKHKVVSIVEKKRRAGFEGNRDTKIRNLANGYVFCQTVENIPPGLAELAEKASYVCQSDFAGVDVGLNEKNNDLFIIEVNSAPGIEGANVEKYTNEILKYAN